MFEEFRDGLAVFLMHLLRNQQSAEDVLQEVWIASRSGIASAREPRAWLYGVTRKMAIRHMRSEQRRRFYEFSAASPEREESREEDVLRSVRVLSVLESTLGDRDRALVMLHHVHGFDADELATALGIRPSAARQRISRANRRLARALRNSDVGRASDE